MAAWLVTQHLTTTLLNAQCGWIVLSLMVSPLARQALPSTTVDAAVPNLGNVSCPCSGKQKYELVSREKLDLSESILDK